MTKLASKTDVELQRLRRDPSNFGYVFDAALEPKLRVRLGESFVVETEDALTGRLLEGGTLPTAEFMPELLATPAKLNPISGPIYVDAVSKGDLLAVHIERVEPADVGSLALLEGVGPGYGWRRWELFDRPRRYLVEHHPGPSGTTRDGSLTIGRFSWSLNPLIGTIGVAPEYVPESSLWGQTPAGGVLDNRNICEGSTIFFNAYHDGALLFLGDMHAAQGDCEFFGIADEARGEVQLRCEVVRSKTIPFPRIERDDCVIQLYASRPLEHAVTTATRLLMEWLVEDYGCTEEEAYFLVDINPDFRITVGVMVTYDPILYTVSAEVKKAPFAGNGSPRAG